MQYIHYHLYQILPHFLLFWMFFLHKILHRFPPSSNKDQFGSKTAYLFFTQSLQFKQKVHHIVVQCVFCYTPLVFPTIFTTSTFKILHIHFTFNSGFPSSWTSVTWRKSQSEFHAYPVLLLDRYDKTIKVSNLLRIYTSNTSPII